MIDCSGMLSVIGDAERKKREPPAVRMEPASGDRGLSSRMGTPRPLPFGILRSAALRM